MLVRLDSTIAPPSSTMRGRRARQVAHPEGKVCQPELIHGPPLTRSERCGLPEGQQLNGGRPPPDELRRHVHIGELHEPGELGTDGVRLGLLEAECVAVEAQ